MSIPYFDAHCDTIVEADLSEKGLLQNSGHLDLERLSRFSPCAQVFAICTAFLENAQNDARIYIERFHAEIAKNSDIICHCLNRADIDTAIKDGKIAALLSIEGAEQVTSPEKAYNDGVRIIHPTWNNDNALSGSAAGSGSGLTEHGKKYVHRCQAMGILLDMSHISERGFWDVLEIAEKPVIAGHSNSKALCNVPRNLTDEQFSALEKIGGGAGINLYPEFLGLGRDIAAVVAHIEHFLSLGGEKAVFLGCDFDGIEITPKGIYGVEDMEKLYNELLRRNYSEALVRDIFWNNLYEIIGRAL